MAGGDLAGWQLSFAVLPGTALDPLAWPAVWAFGVWFAWFGTGVGAQVYRFARVSTPTQRQQTKWVVFGLATGFTAAVLVNLPAALSPPAGTPGHPGPIYDLLRGPATYFAVLLAPISLGLAVLRFRLWDIDILINRTLVYVPLTAVLAGLYSASIAVSQRLFVALTGEKSDAAIVLTTLVMASTFASLRGRLQTAVDKRFKEMPDPTRDLRSIGQQVRAVVEVVDGEALATRLLEEAVAACECESGAVHLWTSDRLRLVRIHGEWTEDKTDFSSVYRGRRNSSGPIVTRTTCSR